VVLSSFCLYDLSGHARSVVFSSISSNSVRACSVIPNTHGLDGIGKNCEEV
jgi:hypothetical protein